MNDFRYAWDYLREYHADEPRVMRLITACLYAVLPDWAY